MIQQLGFDSNNMPYAAPSNEKRQLLDLGKNQKVVNESDIQNFEQSSTDSQNDESGFALFKILIDCLLLKIFIEYILGF
jgi:hypothetical protein